MEKKERDMEKPVGTHMNPTGTLHRDTRIYKEGHCNSRKGRGGQWGRNLGTLPAGETDVTLGDAILGQKFPIGTHFRDNTNSPSQGQMSNMLLAPDFELYYLDNGGGHAPNGDIT